MARVGRFGRQFREATDLTAQIVALYEQYERQRDEVIFDAWQNGGEFEGKPVTDERLLNYIKQKRDLLDKSDPLWAEWDNRLGQYQFAISDQNNSIAYARAVAAASRIRNPRQRAQAMNAASAMRANFFRRSATEHPRNSAAYRDLMLKAAQFSRVQQVARASADKMTDHDRFMKRYEGIYEDKIKPVETVLDALEMFLVKNGKLSMDEANAGNGLWLMDTQEWGDLHSLLSGAQNDPGWTRLSRVIARHIPGWDGNLDPGDFHALANVALRGVNDQIRLAKQQKGDYRGYIDQAKGRREFIQRVSVMDRRASIFERYNQGWERHRDALREADGDPFDEAEANRIWVEELNRLKGKAMRGAKDSPEMLELYASLDAEVNMTTGNVEAVQKASAVPLYMASEGASGGVGGSQASEAVEENARMAKEHADKMSGLLAGTHVYVPKSTGSSVDQQSTEPFGGAAPTYDIVELVKDDITGQYAQDPMTRIMPMSFSGGRYMDADGQMVSAPRGAISAAVAMKPVFGWQYTPDAQDPNAPGQWSQVALGVVGFHQGVRVWEMFRDPAKGAAGGIWATTGDLDKWTDAEMKQVEGGYLLAPQGLPDAANDLAFDQRLTEVSQRTVEAALKNFEPTAAGSQPRPEFEAPQGQDAATTFGATAERAAAGRAPGPGEGLFPGAIGNILGVAGEFLGQAAYELGQVPANIFGENDREREARLAREGREFQAEADSKGYIWDSSWAGRYEGSMNGLKLYMDGPLSYGDVVSSYINYDQQTRKTFTSVAAQDIMAIAAKNGWAESTLVGVANSWDAALQLADEIHEARVLQRMADSDWRIDPLATFEYAETRLGQRKGAWQTFTESYGMSDPADVTRPTNIERSPFYDPRMQGEVPNAQAMDFTAHVSTQPSTEVPGLGRIADPVNELGDLPGPPRPEETGIAAPKQIKVPILPNMFGGKLALNLPAMPSTQAGASGGVYGGGQRGGIAEAAQNTPAPPKAYNYNPYNPAFRK